MIIQQSIIDNKLFLLSASRESAGRNEFAILTRFENPETASYICSPKIFITMGKLYEKEEIYDREAIDEIAGHYKRILELLGEDTSRE